MVLALMLILLSLLIQPAFAEENYADLDIDQLRTKAEQGNARAQLVLGVRYEQGQGVFQDHEEAARWYRLAFEQGNASAQIMLYQIDSSVGRRGVSNGRIQGVPEDDKEATNWSRLVADHADHGTVVISLMISLTLWVRRNAKASSTSSHPAVGMSPGMEKCPYCAGETPDYAIACCNCGRDLEPNN